MCRRRVAGWVVALVLLFSSAFGEDFQLPAGLVTIEEDAFAGIPSMRDVTVPAGLETDFGEAFPEADETIWVHAPQGELALKLLNSGYDVDAETTYRALLICQTYPNGGTLVGPGNDGKAMSYLLTHLNKTNYQVTKRENVSTSEMLSSISTAFGSASEYDVSLFYYSGHGAAGGSLMGCSEGKIDYSDELIPAVLRTALDAIPGRKVIIIDACFSGGILKVAENDETEISVETTVGVLSDPAGYLGTVTALGMGEIKEPEKTENAKETGETAFTGEFEGIEETAEAEASEAVDETAKLRDADGKEVESDGDKETSETEMPNPADFNADFLNAFFPTAPTGRRRLGTRSAVSYSIYYIMTAAMVTEESYEGPPYPEFDETKMGFFTRYLCMGCGWDGLYGVETPAYADANGDGLVTFGEAFAYAKSGALAGVQEYNVVQNAQSNAPDLQAFSPFR